jgi:glycosyltransferase involved in cell wall biosynthesis
MQQILKPTLSVVIPVYRNEDSIADLVAAVSALSRVAEGRFEAVFVVDGSPDRSYALLRSALPSAAFASQLITLSRNFGSFAAIRLGLSRAQGTYIAVMAADLQEPPELIERFLKALRERECEVVFGVREARDDALSSKFASRVFWALYRRMVMRDIPSGGVDIFALTAEFRDRLLSLSESNTSLLAQLFWLGGRREFVPYIRRKRQHGRSAWTISKKLRYLSDSVFSFTDLPVRMLLGLGLFTLLVAIVMGSVILLAKASGVVVVPGYAGTMLTILFFGAFNALGLGVVGEYAWRTYENTKARPLVLVQTEELFG